MSLEKLANKEMKKQEDSFKEKCLVCNQEIDDTYVEDVLVTLNGAPGSGSSVTLAVTICRRHNNLLQAAARKRLTDTIEDYQKVSDG